MMHSKSDIKVKITISIVSFILFIAMLELGLRLSFLVYTRSRQNFVATDDLTCDKGLRYRFLSIGDSYTFGGGVEPSESYPFFLQKKLNDEKGGGFKVINGGICEANSTVVFNYLRRYIENEPIKPDYAIILTGTANRFFFLGLEEFFRGRRTPLSYVRDLKVAGMIRIFAANLRGYLLGRRASEVLREIYAGVDEVIYCGVPVSGEPDENDVAEYQNYLRMAESYMNDKNYTDAISVLEKYLQQNTGAASVYVNLARALRFLDERDLSKEKLKKAISLEPGHNEHYAYSELGCMKLEDGNFSSGAGYILKAIRLSPEWEAGYSLIKRAYTLQSRYSASDVLDAIEEEKEVWSINSSNAYLSDMLDFFKKRKPRQEKIERWLEYDLERIIRFCRAKGITPVLMNYPYPYTWANEILEKTAISFSTPFVDNYAVFERLVEKDGRDMYFVSHDHATPKGHQVMVENIFELITRGEILPGLKAE